MKTLHITTAVLGAVLVCGVVLAQDGPAPECAKGLERGLAFRPQRGGPGGFQGRGQTQGFRGQRGGPGGMQGPRQQRGGPGQGFRGQRGGPGGMQGGRPQRGGPGQGFSGKRGGPGGQQGGRRSRIPSPEILKNAGATDEQIEQLKELREGQEVKQVELRAEVEKAQIALRQLMSDPEASEKDVLKAFDEVSEAKAAIMKQGISARFKAREILGEEVAKKLREQAPKGRAPGGGKGGPRGQGGPGGRPQGPRGRVDADGPEPDHVEA